jgi:PAS domain S-box-containing protein
MKDIERDELIRKLRRHQEELEHQNLQLREHQRITEENQRIAEEYQSRYRDLFEYAPLPYFILDRFGHITEINQAAKRLLKKREKFLIGSPLRIHVAPESRGVFDRHLRSVLLDSEGSCELRLRTGAWIRMESRRVSPRHGKDQVRSALIDITYRKEAEETLREKEERYRQVVEVQSDLICRFQPQGILSFVNPAFCRVVKMTEQELIGKSFFMFLDKADVDRLTALMNEVTPEDPERSIVLQITIGGRIYWMDWIGRALFSSQGQFIEYQAVGRDITQQRRAEKACRESEERLVLAQQAGRVGVFDWDLATNRAVWTSQLEDIYGLPRGGFEANYETWASRVQPEDLERLKTFFREWFQSDRNEDQWEYRLTHPEKGMLWISSRARLIRDETGRPVRMIGTSLDITERRNAEEALRLRSFQLEAANAELESFAYSISHDLRAPLRAIDGFAGMIIQDYEDSMDKELKRRFDVIRKNAQRMARLIDDLLTITRLGRHVFVRDLVDMEKTVWEAWAELCQSFPENRAELVVDSLPPASADRVLLKQVVLNLLSNAMKFTRSRKDARIEAGSYPEEKGTVYFIRDNGVGFNMKYADKLFRIFQRLHDSAQFEGTGVGLAIVQRAIRRHGGRVWAEGKENEGATFYFSLPN